MPRDPPVAHRAEVVGRKRTLSQQNRCHRAMADTRAMLMLVQTMLAAFGESLAPAPLKSGGLRKARVGSEGYLREMRTTSVSVRQARVVPLRGGTEKLRIDQRIEQGLAFPRLDAAQALHLFRCES